VLFRRQSLQFVCRSCALRRVDFVTNKVVMKAATRKEQYPMCFASFVNLDAMFTLLGCRRLATHGVASWLQSQFAMPLRK
jgi:hypothetical protein